MDRVGIHGLSLSGRPRSEPAEPRSQNSDRGRAQAPRNWLVKTSSASVSPSNLSDQNMSFNANCIWRDGSQVLLITRQVVLIPAAHLPVPTPRRKRRGVVDAFRVGRERRRGLVYVSRGARTGNLRERKQEGHSQEHRFETRRIQNLRTASRRLGLALRLRWSR